MDLAASPSQPRSSEPAEHSLGSEAHSLGRAAHPADRHTHIRVRGAREHNLTGVDVDIPKRRLTVFTGVSGSGKSSLVFSTIAAESQRLINETYSAFVQGFMPALPRPDVDVMEGLTTAIIVDQERMGANPRSTVGTATDVQTLLRILFSKLGEPQIGPPTAFSFNVASVSGAGAVTFERGGSRVKERRSFEVKGGMCTECEGTGRVNDVELGELYDDTLSLRDGALRVPGYSMDGWYGRLFSALLPFDVPIRDFTDEQLHDLLYREPTKVKVDGTNLTYEGLIPRIRKSMLSKDRSEMRPHIRAFVDRAFVFRPCPACDGTRLNETARSAKIRGLSIADAAALQLTDLEAWVAQIEAPEVAPLLEKLRETLRAFVTIGLGYLTLDRPTGTLSGGESQRTKMIRHLGSPITDASYVFDEPSIGLHPHDIERMNELLLQLRDAGNTVLVVEHKPEVISIADHVIDLGPGAGSAGGTVCYEGTLEGLRDSETLTGRHLDDRMHLKDRVRSSRGAIEIRGADLHNLRGIDVDVPLGVLSVVTGVAGSGKSSLVHGYISPREGVVTIDQSPLTGSRRSNPATISGALDPIRAAFAKANGVKPALFSSNSEGACPECSGTGVVTTELGMMSTVERVCPLCEGRRFDAAVLNYRLGGKSIADVLALSITEAVDFFRSADTRVPKAVKVLEHMVDTGIGYLTLGQPISTLSGGERQRLKLAIHLRDNAEIIVLDEPTTGLHLADVRQLLELLDRIVDAGTTVIVVEHHQAVMAHADHIIDLGPGAGHEGGDIVFAGTPQELIERGTTLTAQHLDAYLSGR